MNKPDPIVLNYELREWCIDFSKDGYDIGEVGPQYVSYHATVVWGTEDQTKRWSDLKRVEKSFDTLEAAKEFIKEETGIIV